MVDINFENKFWISIISDHLDFLGDKLAPSENQVLSVVNALKLRVLSLKDITIKKGLEEYLQLANEVRGLKTDLLNMLLNNVVKLHLAPTFLNHMINEVDEYISILNHVLNGDPLDVSPIHLHLVWLPDAAGHARAVACDLDEVEALDIKRLIKSKKIFKKLFMKAVEFKGYLRAANLEGSNVLKGLNDEAVVHLGGFVNHLEELGVLRRDGTKLGIITDQMLNHMIREELYYLTKLGYSVKSPLSEDLMQK